MTIHHAILRKAEKLGVAISEDKETDTFDCHWVEKNVHAFGVGQFGKVAMTQMEAVIEIATKLGPEFRIKNVPTDPWQIKVYNHDLSLTLDREGGLPVDMLAILNNHGDKPWFTTVVPTDGAQAYKEGWTAADNPHTEPEEDDESDPDREAWVAWNEAWDAAADAAQEAEDAEPSGSVVKPEYRIRYAEAGHPNHCGDWLAETLNNLILGKTHTDIDNFEALCNLNGVSLAKYKREGNGWQGRLRMTGRNLLARAVYEADGVLKIPAQLQELAGGSTELRADADWMAGQRFKGKKKVEATTTITEQAVTPLVPEDPAMHAPAADLEPGTLGGAEITGDDEPRYHPAHVEDNMGPPSVQEQLARHKKSKRK